LGRNLAQSGLSDPTFVAGGFEFSVAGAEDDGDVRRLLRENATEGWIHLSFEREPSAFLHSGPFAAHAFIIARELQSGEAAGICERASRDAFVDGETRRLAYLGSLRIAPRFRNRIRLLKGGFESVRRLLREPEALPYALTAIGADNAPALRMLQAGVPGMPRYLPVGVVSTFALRPASYRQVEAVDVATAADLPAIAAHLNRCHRHLQFAPVWTPRDLARCRGLRPEDFLVVRRGLGIAGCIALWDQSAFKQVVVRGYAPWLAHTRPMVNAAAALLRVPALPAVGEPLRQVYLSHLAVENDAPELLGVLVGAALSAAHRRGFTLTVTGMARERAGARVIAERYRFREYRSVVHVVHWDEDRAAATAAARGPLHVELALL
jgi:hypothetical protein